MPISFLTHPPLSIQYSKIGRGRSLLDVMNKKVIGKKWHVMTSGLVRWSQTKIPLQNGCNSTVPIWCSLHHFRSSSQQCISTHYTLFSKVLVRNLLKLYVTWIPRWSDLNECSTTNYIFRGFSAKVAKGEYPFIRLKIELEWQHHKKLLKEPQ